MEPAIPILVIGFIYSVVVSSMAYKESGQKWMLWQPHWIDKAHGVSRRLRIHGIIAFAVLFIGVALFLI